MADTFLFRNNALSTLASGINDTDTAIFLQTGDGALFPSPAAGQRFSVTLTDASGNIEIVYCSDQPSADELTVSRAEEGTTALSWLAGDSIDIRITRGVLEAILQGDTVVIANTNADQVDGLEAAASATPGALLALDGSAILQATVANALLLEGGDSAYHRARGNHTGTQLLSSISDAGALAGVDNVGELFTASGNFTVPSGVTSVNIIVVGGGGGGGESGDVDSGTRGGVGGGGRAGRITLSTPTVIPGAVIPITVGSGGAGGTGGSSLSDGNDGSAGGITTFIDSPGALSGTVDAATNANPCVITDTAHDLTTGDMINITGVGGMTELNGNDYIVTVLTADTFLLDGINSSAYGVFSGAGLWTKHGPITALGGAGGDGGVVDAETVVLPGDDGQNFTPYGNGGIGDTGVGDVGGVSSGGAGGGNNANLADGGDGGDGMVWIYW